jgi:butyryl-CoA dehydrogenase
MEIELTEEQRLLRETCREFADRELKPNAKRWDREHKYPAETVKKAVELGLGGVAVPAEWGGAGMDNVAYALAIEEISRGCASVGVTLSVNNSLYCDPVLKYGTEAQKERWLKPFAAGEKLGCFGLTEPQAGSDAAEQRTTAVRRGDRYVINGTKNWITNGPVADAIVLFTMTDLC